MAALSSRSFSRSRCFVAALAALLLVVLQAFAAAPAHAHAGLDARAAAVCGPLGSDAPVTPSAPCADPCLLCAAGAVLYAPARTVGGVAAAIEAQRRPLPGPRLSRAPPGFASSWSSQAPPLFL